MDARIRWPLYMVEHQAGWPMVLQPYNPTIPGLNGTIVFTGPDTEPPAPFMPLAYPQAGHPESRTIAWSYSGPLVRTWQLEWLDPHDGLWVTSPYGAYDAENHDFNSLPYIGFTPDPVNNPIVWRVRAINNAGEFVSDPGRFIVAAPAGPTVLVSDSFPTDGPLTTTETGQAWTVIGADNTGVVGGRLQTGWGYVTTDAGTSDVDITLRLVVNDNSAWPTVAFSMLPDYPGFPWATQSLCSFARTDGWHLSLLFQHTDNSFSSISASGPENITADSTVRIVRQGGHVTIMIDGVTVYDDTPVVANAALATGTVIGFTEFGGNYGPWYDDLIVTAV